MADNIAITPGSGASVATDEVTTLNGGTVAAVQVQRVKVQYGADGSATDVSSTTPLPVTTPNGIIITQSGAANGFLTNIDTLGYASFSVQVGGTFSATVNFFASNDNTNYFAQPATAANTQVSAAALTSSTTSSGIFYGNLAARYLRFQLNPYTSGTANLTIYLYTAPVTSPGLRVAMDTSNVGTTNAVSLAQLGATTIATSNGATNTGTLRVSLASDSTGQTAVATRTTGGSTAFTQISAATTNAASVKATTGTVYGIQALNTGASNAFLKLYNKATAPTVGTDTAVMTLIIPAGGGITVPVAPQGIAFATGIALAVTGAATTADTTAVALSQVVTNIQYA